MQSVWNTMFYPAFFIHSSAQWQTFANRWAKRASITFVLCVLKDFVDPVHWIFSELQQQCLNALSSKHCTHNKVWNPACFSGCGRPFWDALRSSKNCLATKACKVKRSLLACEGSAFQFPCFHTAAPSQRESSLSRHHHSSPGFALRRLKSLKQHCAFYLEIRQCSKETAVPNFANLKPFSFFWRKVWNSPEKYKT